MTRGCWHVLRITGTQSEQVRHVYLKSPRQERSHAHLIHVNRAMLSEPWIWCA